MPKAKFKNAQFTVINNKLLERVDPQVAHAFRHLLAIIQQPPHRSYYVCNTDEPYSQQVLDTILAGEDAKKDA